MESEPRTWALSPEAQELAFVRTMLRNLRQETRKFAEQHDISYDIDEDIPSERLRILPTHGDFTPLKAHIEGLIPHMNELLATHAPSYTIDIRDYDQGLHIEAIRRSA